MRRDVSVGARSDCRSPDGAVPQGLRRRGYVRRSLPVLRAYGTVQEQVDELATVVFGSMLARSGGAAEKLAQVGVGEHVHGQS